MQMLDELLQKLTANSLDPTSVVGGAPEASPELSATLEATASKGTEWQTQSPGIYKRQGAKGMEYTNVVDSAGAPTMGKGTPTPESGPTFMGNSSGAKVGPKALIQRMQEISAEVDPDKKAEALVAFKGDAASMLTSMTKDIRSVAEVQAGIPALIHQVKQSEDLDKKHPAYSKYLTDSNSTLLVKQQLAAANANADRLTKQLTVENPELAGIAAQVDGFLKLNDQQLQKDLNRQDVQQQRIDEFMSAVSPETLEDVWTIRPDLKGNTKATAQFLSQELKMNRKEWEPIVSGTIKPDELLMHGVMGNKVAAAMAVKKQVAATGLPESIVMKQAKVLNDFVNNPAVAEKAIKDFNLFDSSDAAKSYQMLGMKGNTQGAADQTKVRVALMDKLASRITVSAVDSNIDSWPVAPGSIGLINIPEAGPIFQSFQSASGRKPTIQEFNNAFVNAADIPAEERVRRSTLVKEAYTNVLKKASSGIYGKDIDVIGLTNKLAVRGVMQSIPNIQSWR